MFSLSLCSLENLQQKKSCPILATWARGWTTAAAPEASEFHALPGALRCGLAVQETDTGSLSPPQGKPAHVPREKGALPRYGDSLGLAEFALSLELVSRPIMHHHKNPPIFTSSCSPFGALVLDPSNFSIRPQLVELYLIILPPSEGSGGGIKGAQRQIMRAAEVPWNGTIAAQQGTCHRRHQHQPPRPSTSAAVAAGDQGETLPLLPRTPTAVG